MTIYRTRPWLGNRQDSQSMSPYEAVIFSRSVWTVEYADSNMLGEILVAASLTAMFLHPLSPNR
jgi:hypothetical protein